MRFMEFLHKKDIAGALEVLKEFPEFPANDVGIDTPAYRALDLHTSVCMSRSLVVLFLTSRVCWFYSSSYGGYRDGRTAFMLASQLSEDEPLRREILVELKRRGAAIDGVCLTVFWRSQCAAVLKYSNSTCGMSS